MRRHAILLALLALLCTTFGGSAIAAGPTAHDAAKKKQTRAQKLKACTKKAKKKPSAAARRRAARRCRARFGPRKPAPKLDGTNGTTTPGTTGTPGTPGTPPPAIDPVRDDAGFRAAMTGHGLYRQYEVPKPNHGIGYNTHEDIYVFCPTTAFHLYEGIAYIYRTNGPWEVVEGFVNGDRTRGHGTIRYTQATANFDEEIGKVQEIRIEWNGTGATVTHPEIGTYPFTVVANAPCT